MVALCVLFAAAQIFYQVCAGITAQERQTYRLENAKYYHYLSCSGCYEVAGINDVADWKEMNESFQVVGISEAERQEVIRAVSVCLWLGNLAFHEPKSEVAEVMDRQVLDIVAGLLQVHSQALEHALCNRQIQTGVGAKGQWQLQISIRGNYALTEGIRR
jgi:myosin-1